MKAGFAEVLSMRGSRRIELSALCTIALLVAACGGGGGSSGGSAGIPSGGSGSSSPPPQNRPPIILIPVRSERVISGRPVLLDLPITSIFSDPDGDRLAITVGWDFHSGSQESWNGLRIVGDRIEGIAVQPETNAVSIAATDGRGGQAVYRIEFTVAANQAPIVRAPARDQLVRIGEAIHFDVTQSGTVFVDPDGDPLTYSVTLEPAPRGLQVGGSIVTGQLAAVGAVRVIVNASDGFGGVGTDRSIVAAPAAEPGPPRLPVASYVYDDSLLGWPEIFRLSREREIPFWDTTPPGNPTTNAGATLGRVLFYDKRLSITNTHSCGSCHEQQRGFTVATPFAAGVTDELSRRNPMALVNARYNIHGRYFGDLRAAGLEELALMPIEDQIELGNTLPAVIDKLSRTDFYPPMFAAAFGSEDITAGRIARAIAQFLRSIVSYRSKFDRAYHSVYPSANADPTTVLTSQELLGAEMYVHGNCGHCHTIGIQTNDRPANNGLDAQFTDAGAGDGKFRATSLRNIAVTGPYMHDGRFATLREVIDHYDSEVKASPQLDFLLRDHHGAGSDFPRRLDMTEVQKQALEAFLNTFTDDDLLSDPKFSDPF